MQKRLWWQGLLVALPVGVVALVGTFFTDASSPWYTSLRKAALQPPGYVFGIVWTAIYILSAVALYIAVTSGMRFPTRLILALIANGVLNMLWPLVCFGWQNIGASIGVLVALVLSLLFILEGFWERKRVCALLFLPYLLWGLFALYLNVSLLVLN